MARLGFGHRPSWSGDWNSLGATGAERLDNYITQQLHPGSIDDSAFDSYLASFNFTTLTKGRNALWQQHANGNGGYSTRMRPVAETERAAFLRAVYSKKQLHELLVDFWHDHFNVYGWDYRIGPMFVDYDRVMRTHALGNFGDFLVAVAQHSSMLYYLDQYTSSAAGPNENYARELFELHTLGVDHYYGVQPQDNVPTDGNGTPLGYVDEDVFETMFALTGWTVNDGGSGSNEGQDDGSFYFNLDRHDRGQKRVLGMTIPSNGDVSDGLTVLDLLARHPGTALHIATKLCRRFLGDTPPQSVVDQATQVFLDNVDSPNQLRRVVAVIVRSPELMSRWGEKVKRPFEVVTSAMRAAQMEFDFQFDADDISSFFWRYDATGQPLFSWHPPNGFPDHRNAWQSTTPRVALWRLISWMSDQWKPNGAARLPVVAQTPAELRTATEMADFWIQRLLQRQMDAADRQEIIEFMAAGFSANLDLPLDTDEDTQDRLRSMVALILNSPYFLER